ncbi:MAG: addiction module antidote protein [Thiotrichaceae bacterium]
MTIKTKPFDVSSHLKTDEDIREFLDIMLEENGIEGFQRALGYVAKAKGMKEIAEKTKYEPFQFIQVTR